MNPIYTKRVTIVPGSQSTDDRHAGRRVRVHGNYMRYRMRNIMRHVLVFFVAIFLSSTGYAQVRVDLSSNVDCQPIWGPTGYDHVEFYYLPDIDVYYNVAGHRFSYYELGYWISRSTLPIRYRDYDLYTAYKVVLNEPTPYRKCTTYREKYSSYKGRHDQQPIRDSRDSKYFANANHPEHYNWIKQQRQDSSNGREKGRGD